MKVLLRVYSVVILLALVGNACTVSNEGKNYWKHEKRRDSRFADGRILRKRSSLPAASQNYKEIKIDTSKLYDELIAAIRTDKSLNKQNKGAAAQQNTGDRRGQVRAPSIANYVLNKKAQKPAVAAAARTRTPTNRQLIEFALPNSEGPPSAITYDPYWAGGTGKAEGSALVSDPSPIGNAQQAPPLSGGTPGPLSFLTNGDAFEMTSFDADVVPDANGGMRIVHATPKQRNVAPHTPHPPPPPPPPPPPAPAPAPPPPQEFSSNPTQDSVLSSPRNSLEKDLRSSKKEDSASSKRVYSLGEHVFTDVGCFLDKWIRAVPTLEGNHPLLMDSDYKTRSDPLQKCAEAALDKGLKLFALQNGGQCFGGKTGESRIKMYGDSSLCKDDGLGGSWANEVYEYKSDGKPKSNVETKEDLENEDYERRLLMQESILSESDNNQPTKPSAKDDVAFKGALKKIINKVNEKKKQAQAEKNIKIVKEIVKGLKASQQQKESPEHRLLSSSSPALVVRPKQTDEGEGYGRLGLAIARGHKPPCICPDKVCSSKLDLAFIIDAGAGSEQGGKEKMAETMEFGRRVASAFKVSPEESHVGLVTFATDAQIMMNFHRFSDPDALTEARDAVRVKPHTGKYTGQALELAKEGLFDTGHRADALDVAVLLTDGPSSDDVTGPARALRDMGVKLIAVGIGPEVDRMQLNDIASDPDEEHVFTADYDNLATIIGRLQRAACVGGALRDPVEKCKCGMYIKEEVNKENELDKETAAFYNIYKSSVESNEGLDGLNVKYNTILKPTNSGRNPSRFDHIIQYRPFNATRRSNVDIWKKQLPLVNPHPKYLDASPLAELERSRLSPRLRLVNLTNLQEDVVSQRTTTGRLNNTKIKYYEEKLKSYSGEETSSPNSFSGKENGDSASNQNTGKKESSNSKHFSNEKAGKEREEEDKNLKSERENPKTQQKQSYSDERISSNQDSENERKENSNDKSFSEGNYKVKDREEGSQHKESPKKGRKLSDREEEAEDKVSSYSSKSEDSEYDSKEKERLIANYLRAHRKEFEDEDDGGDRGSKHHNKHHGPTSEPEEEEDHPGISKMYLHESSRKLEKEKPYDDDRFYSNSEGKLHPFEEEQVLADGKPLRQAGGSHELPFEVMKKLHDQSHHRQHTEDDEDSDEKPHRFKNEDSFSKEEEDDDENDGARRRKRKKKFKETDDSGEEEKSREQQNEERYKHLFEESSETPEDRSSKVDFKEKNKKKPTFTSESEDVENEKEENDDPKFKHFKGMRFKYGPDTQLSFKSNDKPKKKKKAKKIYPEDTDSEYVPVSQRKKPSKNRYQGNEDGEGSAPAPFEPSEKLTYHPTKSSKKYRSGNDGIEDHEIRKLLSPPGEVEENHDTASNRNSLEKEEEQDHTHRHPHVRGYADSHATFRVHTGKKETPVVDSDIDGNNRERESRHRYHEKEEEAGRGEQPGEGAGDTVDSIKVTDGEKDKDVKIANNDDDEKKDKKDKKKLLQDDGEKDKDMKVASNDDDEKKYKKDEKKLLQDDKFDNDDNDKERVKSKHRYSEKDEESGKDKKPGEGAGDPVDNIKVTDGGKDKDKKVTNNDDDEKKDKKKLLKGDNFDNDDNDKEKERVKSKHRYSEKEEESDKDKKPEESVGDTVDKVRVTNGGKDKDMKITNDNDDDKKDKKESSRFSDQQKEEAEAEKKKEEEEVYWRHAKQRMEEKEKEKKEKEEEKKKKEEKSAWKQVDLSPNDVKELNEDDGLRGKQKNDEKHEKEFKASQKEDEKHENKLKTSHKEDEKHENEFETSHKEDEKENSQHKIYSEPSHNQKQDKEKSSNEGFSFSTEQKWRDERKENQERNSKGDEKNNYENEYKKGKEKVKENGDAKKGDDDKYSKHLLNLAQGYKSPVEKQTSLGEDSKSLSDFGTKENKNLEKPTKGSAHFFEEGKTSEMFSGKADELMEHAGIVSADSHGVLHRDDNTRGNEETRRFSEYEVSEQRGSSNPYVAEEIDARYFSKKSAKPQYTSREKKESSKDQNPSYRENRESTRGNIPMYGIKSSVDEGKLKGKWQLLNEKKSKEASYGSRKNSNVSPLKQRSYGEETPQVKDLLETSEPYYVTDANDLKEGNIAKHHISRKIIQRPAKMAELKKTRQVPGTRRDETDKGILTSDPFIDAAHFWPFDKSTSVLTTDLVTGATSILMNGASIKKDGRKDDVFPAYLDTHSKDSTAYAIVGDFKGTCFSDPDECKLGGMTVYAWLKLSKDDFVPDKDQYILSSGGQSKKSRGFAFLNFHGHYVLVLSTKDKQWKITMPKDKLKLDEWECLTFVWNSRNDTLTFYLNGHKLDGEVSGTVLSQKRDKLEYTILTIGRPNNAINKEFMMHLKMAELTLWDRALTQTEVSTAFTNVKEHVDERRRKRSFARKHLIPRIPIVDRIL